MPDHEGVRVYGEAEVQPAVARVAGSDLHVGNGPQRQVVEHLPARAGDLAEVDVPVCALVAVAQGLSLGDERLAQPRARHGEIAALMHEAAALGDERFGVDPRRCRARRVVAAQRDRPVAARAANDAGADGAHVVHAGELGKLLEPEEAEISPRKGDGLRLRRVIRATKEDALAGRLVDDLHRRNAEAEPRLQPHAAYDPCQLLVDALAQRRRHLAVDDGVCQRVAQHAQHDLCRRERRLARAAPAAQPVFGVPAPADVPMQFQKRRRNEGGDARVSHRRRPRRR